LLVANRKLQKCKRLAKISQTFFMVMLLCGLSVVAARAQSSNDYLKTASGKEIFEAGCVGCHGADGKGEPQTILGFLPPSSFPAFSDCPSTSPEPDSTWRAIITNGGSFRGFSEIMPSFKEQLSTEQIDRIIGYLRSLCSDTSWPRG